MSKAITVTVPKGMSIAISGLGRLGGGTHIIELNKQHQAEAEAQGATVTATTAIKQTAKTGGPNGGK